VLLLKLLLFDPRTMIMVNYADLWLVHSHVASLLDDARVELSELKAHSTQLGACTTCPLLRSDLEAATIEIKDLKHNLINLLATLSYPLSRVSFSMLPKRISSLNRRSLI
jgi:hypothetical protein